MKKFSIIASFFIAIVFSVLISSVVFSDRLEDPDFSVGTPNNPIGDPGTTVTVNVDITNHGTSAKFYTVFGTSLIRVGGTESIPAPFSTITNTIINGSTGTGSLTVNIPITLLGTYAGTLTVTDTSNASNQVSVPYSITVNAKPKIEFPDGTLKLQSEPKSKTIVTQFRIKNSGSVVLNNILIPENTFTDGDNNQFKITGSVASSTLNPGAITTGTLNIQIPEDAAIESHTKSIIVNSQQIANSAFSLELKIQPELCKNGVQSVNYDVDIEIKDPDNGDDFEVGDTINIRVEVTNNDNRNHDFVAKAILYDKSKNKKIETAESDSLDINDDDSDTIEFELQIPSDEDIDSDDDFVLFVKAYQDGSENKECNEESIDLNIQVPSHKVIIDSTSISPSQVNCGDTVTASVDVRNVGDNIERNVRVRAREPTLNINVISDMFTLERLGKTGNQETRTLAFTVPNNAKTGEYTIELLAEPGTANKVSEFEKLQVNCEKPYTIVELSLPSFTIKADQGSILEIPVTLRNNDNKQKTLTIESKATGDFASSDSQQISLDANEEGTVTLAMSVNSAAPTGIKTVTITVKDGSNIIASKTVPVTIESKSSPITGATTGTTNLFGSSKNAGIFFIIADILLVIIALYVLVLIFRRKKKD